MRRTAFPSQSQLLLPLLDVLAAAGGTATVSDVASALATRLHVPQEATTRRVPTGGRRRGTVNAWHRHVRWVYQRAKQQGVATGSARGAWSLTAAGRDGLRPAAPGVILTVLETPSGHALWATCETALRTMASGSTHLILTSPPYGLARSKPYESRAADENVRWLLECAAEWHRLLTDDGTVLLNLGPAWQKGQGPVQSIWRQELVVGMVRELGFHLAQTFYVANPSKLPGPAQYVTVQKIRVTESVEEVFAFVKSRHASRWDSTRVPRTSYSPSMRRRLAQGGEAHARVRPSGHTVTVGAFGTDHGGALPRNLLPIPNTASAGAYRRHCRALGLPAHPATFPARMVEWLIQLTTRVGDRVGDPFGGSLQTAAACERLGREWWTTERSLTYLAGGLGRFQDVPDADDHLGVLRPRCTGGEAPPPVTPP